MKKDDFSILPEGWTLGKVRKIRRVPVSRRIGAYILDFLIFYFLIYAQFMFIYYFKVGIPLDLGFDSYQTLAGNNLFTVPIMAGFFAFFMLFFVYLSLFEYFSNATPGMTLMGISVGPDKLTFGQAFLRNVTKSLFLSLLIIDIIPMFLSENQQRFSEILSRTYVYSVSGRK